MSRNGTSCCAKRGFAMASTNLLNDPSKLTWHPKGWGLIDLPLRASNEGFLKPALREHRRSSDSIPSPLYWGIPSHLPTP